MLNPPCNCKPSNVNNFAPAKSPYQPSAKNLLEGNKLRPQRMFSLSTALPNVFQRDAQQWSLTTYNDSTSDNMVRKLQTPRKKRDLEARAK